MNRASLVLVRSRLQRLGTTGLGGVGAQLIL